MINTEENQGNSYIQLNYKLTNANKEVGSLNSKYRYIDSEGDRMIEIENQISMEIERLRFSLSYQSTESIKFDAKGLLEYSGSQVENDKKLTMDVKRVNSILQLFSIDQNNNKQKNSISLNEYEVTSDNACNHFLELGEERRVQKVLDLERFEVEWVEFRRKGQEALALAGKKWDCEIVFVVNQAAKIKSKKWLARFNDGYEDNYIIIKEMLTEEGDTTHILLNEIVLNS